jgi:F-type H+-transporting ATPase subunit delta
MASFASIYARALTDVVVERKLNADKVATELDAVSRVLAESEQLRTVWESPSVHAGQKLKLLDAIAVRIGLSREVRNFVAVLISKRRISAFADIAKTAVQHINQALGIADAEIVSARELTAEQKKLLESQVATLTGKSLRVRYALDPGLMGGALVKVGSTVYDGSVRGQLQRMKEQLINS